MTLCERGAAYGHAGRVLAVCEAAVGRSPGHGVPRVPRDRRVLTGDPGGAADDLELFVEWLETQGTYEAGAHGREAWIAVLRAGQVPFDPDTLEQALLTRGQPL